MIGISGGLDSTLALLVTVRAFDLLGIPRENILSVTMPCFGTTDRTYQNACQLTKKLGATLKEVDIREAVTIHFRDIEQDPSVHDVTYENSQARQRTLVLMNLANEGSEDDFDQMLSEAVKLGVDYMQKKDFQINSFLQDTANLRELAEKL